MNTEEQRIERIFCSVTDVRNKKKKATFNKPNQQLRYELTSTRMSDLCFFFLVIMDICWHNFAPFLFLPLLQWVTCCLYVWEMCDGLNWNRKYAFPEYFTFNGACLKVSRLARGPHAFQISITFH